MPKKLKKKCCKKYKKKGNACKRCPVLACLAKKVAKTGKSPKELTKSAALAASL